MSQDFSIWYTAARALLNGQSPYLIHGFVSPVWALLPFLPLTLLPEMIASHVYLLISLFGTLIALARLKVPLMFIPIIVLFTPLVWMNLAFANIEWVVMIGATLAPLMGVWLVILKPQIGIGLLALWAYHLGRTQALILIGLVVSALTINYIVFGLPQPLDLKAWSFDIFPYGLLLGVPLMSWAARKNDRALALASGISVSPYVGITSIISISGLARSKRGLLLITLIGWGFYGVWRLRGV